MLKKKKEPSRTELKDRIIRPLCLHDKIHETRKGEVDHSPRMAQKVWV